MSLCCLINKARSCDPLIDGSPSPSPPFILALGPGAYYFPSEGGPSGEITDRRLEHGLLPPPEGFNNKAQSLVLINLLLFFSPARHPLFGRVAIRIRSTGESHLPRLISTRSLFFSLSIIRDSHLKKGRRLVLFSLLSNIAIIAIIISSRALFDSLFHRLPRGGNEWLKKKGPRNCATCLSLYCQSFLFLLCFFEAT